MKFPITASIRLPEATTMLIVAVGLVVASCRPISPPIRPARVSNVCGIIESDSLSVSEIVTARVLGDSALLALDLSLGRILSIDLRAGHIREDVSVTRNHLHSLWQQIPDTLPEYYVTGAERGRKLDYAEALRYLQRDGALEGGVHVEGFDIHDQDSIFAIAAVRFPYSAVDVNGTPYVDHLGFPFAIKTRHGSDSAKIILLSPELSANFCVVSNGVAVQGSRVWLSAWDWKERTADMMPRDDNWWSRTAGYTRLGVFTGIVSRETTDFDEFRDYRLSNTWLCHGLDTTCYLRILSNRAAVDVVNAEDGSFLRFDLPSPIVEDNKVTFTTHPVRFGGDRFAVVLRVSHPENSIQEHYVFIGKLYVGKALLRWATIIRCRTRDRLLCLVDSNDSPLYRQDLLGIFENPERGPYLARIEVD